MAQTQAQKFPALTVVLDRTEKLNLLKNEDLQKIEDALNVKAEDVIKEMTKGTTLEQLLGVDGVETQNVQEPENTTPILLVLQEGKGFLIAKSEFEKIEEPTKLLRKVGFQAFSRSGKTYYALTTKDIEVLSEKFTIKTEL